jgi:hypothetical protein
VKHVSIEKGNARDIRVQIEVKHEIDDPYVVVMPSVSHKYVYFQSWGDPTDVSQSVVIYIIMSSFVYMYCWLGNELSEEVRIL